MTKTFNDGASDGVQGAVDFLPVTFALNAQFSEPFRVAPGSICAIRHAQAWDAAKLELQHQIEGVGIGTVTAASVSVDDTVTIQDYLGGVTLTFTAKAAEDIADREFNQAGTDDEAATSLAACINATALNVTAVAAAAVVTITAKTGALINVTSSEGTRLAVASPWDEVEDEDGTLPSYTVTAKKYRLVSIGGNAGLAGWLRFRSGVVGTLVTQTAARTLYVGIRRTF